MLVSLLDRYIGRSIFFGTSLALTILLGLYFVVLFLDAAGDLGKANFGLYALLVYVVLSLPTQLYEIFPAVSLIGASAGLSLLALNFELTAMRAAGFSVMNIIASVMKISGLFIIVAVLLGEFVIPVTGELAERFRAEALHGGLQKKKAGIWLREGTSFIRISEVLPDLSLVGVEIYNLDKGPRLQKQTYAERAWFENGRWRLEHVTHSRIEQGQVRTWQARSDTWASRLTPEVVSVFTVRPHLLPTWSLYRYIRHLRLNQQDTTRYEMAFWNKLLLPVSTVIMVLLAVPFVFGQFRSGGISQRVFVGVMLGLAFSLLHKGFGYFGLIYNMPPLLSAALPSLLFLALVIYLFRRVV